MYLVTIAKQGYVQFATTPNGRAAFGLTEAGVVRVLAPGEPGGEWRALREWDGKRFAHTDLVVLLGRLPEPGRAEDLLASLPAETAA
ncbi:MAG: hypothetical protein ACKOCT_07375 [Alphaproteobacteria bacterium]